MRLSKRQALAYLKLSTVASKLSQDTREAINKGTASLKPIVAYIRKGIAVGGGTVRLVDSNTKQLVGITNLEGNRLPAYQNIIFDRIAVGYCANAAAGKEAEGHYNTDFLASLRSAEVEVKQDGVVIVTAPLSEYDYSNTHANENDKYLYLGGEYMLREDKPFEININFPEGATGSGTNDYVEVRLAGIQTTER